MAYSAYENKAIRVGETHRFVSDIKFCRAQSRFHYDWGKIDNIS